jgi:acyl carrier protein
MRVSLSEDVLIDELRSIFRQALGVDPVSPIEPGTRFFADLGLASIDVVVLGEAIQHRFGQRLPFDELLAELGRRAQRDLEIRELIVFLQRSRDEVSCSVPDFSQGTESCLESRPTA